MLYALPVAVIVLALLKKIVSKKRCKRLGHAWKTKNNNSLKCRRCGRKSIVRQVVKPDRSARGL